MKQQPKPSAKPVKSKSQARREKVQKKAVKEESQPEHENPCRHRVDVVRVHPVTSEEKKETIEGDTFIVIGKKGSELTLVTLGRVKDIFELISKMPEIQSRLVMEAMEAAMRKSRELRGNAPTQMLTKEEAGVLTEETLKAGIDKIAHNPIQPDLTPGQ